MMNFIILTISIAVGILLASGLAVFIMLQPKVMNLYFKLVAKNTKGMQDFFEKLTEDL